MPPGSQLGPRVTDALGTLGSPAAAAGAASASPPTRAAATRAAPRRAPLAGGTVLQLRGRTGGSVLGVGLLGTASPSVPLSGTPELRHFIVPEVTHRCLPATRTGRACRAACRE